jgi:hypothetical protein
MQCCMSYNRQMKNISHWPLENQIGFINRIKRKERRSLNESLVLHRKERLEYLTDVFRQNNNSVHGITTAYVYVIANRSFPDWYKIGTCIDLDKRLSTYQTGDPHKSYYFKDFWMTRNRQDTEYAILGDLTRSSSFEVKGEWVYSSNYGNLKKRVRKYVDIKDKKIVEAVKMHKKYLSNQKINDISDN